MPSLQAKLDRLTLDSANGKAQKRAIDPNNAPAANKILVILSYTTDHVPGGVKWNALGAWNTTAERARQRASFDVLVKQWYKQVSYDKVRFDFTVTNFVALPMDDGERAEGEREIEIDRWR